MNSADQGVYPMDTAFKRRWDFEYIDIDNNDNEINDFWFNVAGKQYHWNSLRKAINDQLTDEILVSVIATDFEHSIDFSAVTPFNPINEDKKETFVLQNDTPAPAVEVTPTPSVPSFDDDVSADDILPSFLKD